MKRKQELLAMHPYKIWQGKDERWYTYLPDEEKGRKQIKKSTKDALELEILNYMKSQEEIHIDNIFSEWIEQKLSYGDIQKQTYDRYKTDFKRFFVGSEIIKKDVRKINEIDIETFLRSTISEQKLSNKAYSGLRLLVMGIFKYAKKHGYTDISISQFFGDLELSKRVFKKKTVKSEDSVFTFDEFKKIEAFVSDNPSIINYGILLAFHTGLRVGELAALKSEDIQGNLLTVNKTEVRYRDDDGNYVFEVRESAKTDAGNRTVILTAKSMKLIHLIKRMNPFGEYLFMKDGKRIKEKAFSVKMVKICRYLNINERSMHKARKTCATNMINNGVDESLVAAQLGHTDISCTKQYYYFNNRTLTEAATQLEKASL